MNLKEKKVHLSHCNQGEYEDSCKYGDENCPALIKKIKLPKKYKEEINADFLLNNNYCQNNEFEIVNDFDKVHRIDVSGIYIKNIPDLDKFINLKELILDNCGIEKIDNLYSNDINLLQLTNNKIKKIENISHLKLDVLILSGNKIEIFENLGNLPLELDCCLIDNNPLKYSIYNNKNWKTVDLQIDTDINLLYKNYIVKEKNKEKINILKFKKEKNIDNSIENINFGF